MRILWTSTPFLQRPRLPREAPLLVFSVFSSKKQHIFCTLTVGVDILSVHGDGTLLTRNATLRLIMTNGSTVNPSEVGWQFVPQYYTFVNKQPNRLHCFYTKASTFIHGTEGEDGKPCYGQQVSLNLIGARARALSRYDALFTVRNVLYDYKLDDTCRKAAMIA